ncbi:homeobox protein ceh-60-like [Schistocerca gregaria]|uniref:homeobox protein ceh-60-like n=1 Tax=Schistocerca gregaria TaxID=7010 RepID=UPI00211E4F34|nr:homeobox protein ceh-60-like [Schistocerca gregaria]
MSCNSPVHPCTTAYYDINSLVEDQWNYLSPCSWNSTTAASSASNGSADTVFSLEPVPISGELFRYTNINAAVSPEYDGGAGLDADCTGPDTQKWEEIIDSLADKIMTDYASFIREGGQGSQYSTCVDASISNISKSMVQGILDLPPSALAVKYITEYSDTLSKSVNEVGALFRLAEKFEAEYVKKIYTKTENYVIPIPETDSNYPLFPDTIPEKQMQYDVMYHNQDEPGASGLRCSPEAVPEKITCNNKGTAANSKDSHDKDVKTNNASTQPGQKRHRSNLPSYAREIMKRWLEANIDSPYPSEKDKLELVKKAKITMNQLNNWFINARRRPSPLLAQAQKNSKAHRPGRPKRKRAKVHDMDDNFVL